MKEGDVFAQPVGVLSCCIVPGVGSQADSLVTDKASVKLHHSRLAAIGGHEGARHMLGVMEVKNDNVDRAMKHFLIAARAGEDKSLKEKLIFKKKVRRGVVRDVIPVVMERAKT